MQNIKKKGLSLLFACVLLVSLIGCGSGHIATTTQDASAQTSEVESVQIEEGSETVDTSEPDPEDQEADRKNTDYQEVETEEEGQSPSSATIDESGTYTSKDDVALYLYVYHKLPDNFITKKEAKKLGWTGGSLESYAPGMCIGGDYFGNYEEVLPDGTYHECDIDTLGKSGRGAKRIVYSEDWQIYYTEDHYESFELLYGAE